MLDLIEENFNYPVYENIINDSLLPLNSDINNDFNYTFVEEDKRQKNPYFTQKKEEKINLNNKAFQNKYPNYDSYDSIKQKLKEINSRFLNLFQKDEKIIEAENEMQLIRIKNVKFFEIKEEKNNGMEIKFGIGRKRKEDKNQRSHNKFRTDNIMKKIKAKLFDYLVKFVNEILKKYNEGRQEKDKIIKGLDYKKYIIHLKIKDNIQYLHLSLKDLLSQETKSSFKNDNINSNRDNIINILEKEKDNIIINYIFNMKFREWINILTMKKDDQSSGNMNDIIYEEIKNNMPKIDDLLNEIYIKNDKDMVYLSCFIFYLFNFENYFIIRVPRKRD